MVTGSTLASLASLVPHQQQPGVDRRPALAVHLQRSCELGCDALAPVAEGYDPRGEALPAGEALQPPHLPTNPATRGALYGDEGEQGSHGHLHLGCCFDIRHSLKEG